MRCAPQVNSNINRHRRAGQLAQLELLGLPDEFIEHGEVGKLLSGLGLDAAGIEAAVRKRFVAPLVLVKPAVSQ